MHQKMKLKWAKEIKNFIRELEDEDNIVFWEDETIQRDITIGIFSFIDLLLWV